MYISKYFPRRWLFSVAVLQKDGRELGLVFSSPFLSLSWHASRDFMLYSHIRSSYCLSAALGFFPKGSLITDIHCFERKGNWGKEVLILVADSSHYSLAFPLNHSSGALQTEHQESRPFSWCTRNGDPPFDQSSDPVPAYIFSTSSGPGDWEDQLTLPPACRITSHGLQACLMHQDTLRHVLLYLRSLLSWCALMQNALLPIFSKGN